MRLWLIDRKSALRRAVLRAAGRFGQDRRGGTAVQALVLLPVFIILLTTLIMLWQVVLVRRSLHTGVYEATRYLSLYPLQDNNPAQWEAVAREIITVELMNNPFVRNNLDNLSQMDHGRLDIAVSFPDQEIACKKALLVTVAFRYPMTSLEPFPGPAFTLREVREGEILCD